MGKYGVSAFVQHDRVVCGRKSHIKAILVLLECTLVSI